MNKREDSRQMTATKLDHAAKLIKTSRPAAKA